MNNLNVAKIQLNGEPYEINSGSNLDELLNKLKIDLKLRPQNLDYETYYKLINEYENLRG